MMQRQAIMTPYKASRLHVAWIQFLTGIWTIWYSLRVIFAALLAKNKRAKITEMTRRWSNKLLHPTGLVIHVNGSEQLEGLAGKSVIVMCNHTSLYDIPVSFLALDADLRMLAKKELFSIPILSSALKAGDFVAIDRTNIDQAKRDLKRAESKLRSGIVLWVAPEGTRSRDGQLKPFKKGGFHLAIDTNAIILPVVIKGLDKILPSNSYNLTIHGQVQVQIGEPILTADYTKKQCNELRDSTRLAMQRLLESPDVW